jgi:Ser/Thr protein kinase RdoA (MazF antagonist)
MAHDGTFPSGVAATYGLHPIFAQPLEGGYVNQTWRVECEEGEFAVRRYGRLHVTRKALLFEHAVMAHAAEQMPEVVAPLRAPGGSTLYEHDGGFVAVLPFIAGRTGLRDGAIRRDAARLLARFHRSMRDVHIGGGTRSSRSIGVLGNFRERFLEFAQDGLIGKKLEWDVALTATTAAAARIAPHASQLPHAVVHGDPQPANFVEAEEQVRGLIDFDFAHETERAYDVAVGMDEFGRPHNAAPLDLDAALDFARAYDAELPLGLAERETLPDLMIRRNAMMVWYIVTRHGERSAGDVGGAPLYVERMREIERMHSCLRF